jgi:hypothetical protein
MIKRPFSYRDLSLREQRRRSHGWRRIVLKWLWIEQSKLLG